MKAERLLLAGFWLLAAVLPLFHTGGYLETVLSKNALYFFVVISLLFIWLFRERETFQRDGRLRLILLFLGLVGASAVFSISPATSLMGSYQSWSGVPAYLFMTLTYFLALQVRWDDERIKKLMSVVVFGAALVSLMALVGSGHKLLSIVDTVERETGTLPGPNQLSMYLMFVWPLALRLFLMPGAGRPEKLWFGAAGILIFMANLATLSRAGWATALFVIVVVAAISGEKKRLLWVGGFIAVLLAAVLLNRGPVAMSLKTRVASVFADESMLPRTALWKTAAKMAIARPVTGFGPDAFKVGLPKYEALRVAQFKNKPRTPHNFPLFTGAVLGLPALLLLGVIMLSAIKEGFRADYLRRSLSLSLSTMLFLSLFYQWHVFLQAPFWLLMGVTANRKTVEKQTVGLKAPLLLVGLLLMAWTAWISTADYYFQKGLKVDRSAGAHYLSQAARLNPYIYNYWQSYYPATADRPFGERLKIIKTAQSYHPLQEELVIFEYILRGRNGSTLVELRPLIDRALELRPLSVKARFTRARAMVAQSEYEAAAAELALIKQLTAYQTRYQRSVPRLEELIERR